MTDKIDRPLSTVKADSKENLTSAFVTYIQFEANIEEDIIKFITIRSRSLTNFIEASHVASI